MTYHRRYKMKCDYCNCRIDKRFFFCPECGVKLRQNHTDINAFGEEKEYQKSAKSKQIMCKNCDLYYDYNFSICPWCGYHYKAQPEPELQYERGEFEEEEKTEPTTEVSEYGPNEY